MAQFGATREAAIRLIQAHVDLAKAEFSEILDQAKIIAAGIGVAIAAVVFFALLLSIGGTLFYGEWLYGSMGWGLLHGLELSIGIAVVGIVVALDVPSRLIVRTFLLGLLIGIIVGLAFGLDLTNQGWGRLGDSAFTGLAPDTRPLVLGVTIIGVIFAVLGLVLGARAGGARGGFVGLIVGAIIGAILGALTALQWGPRAGVAMGVAVGLAVWPITLGIWVQSAGIDFEALKAKLYPQQTIDTTMETIEWVRKQTPLGRKS